MLPYHRLLVAASSSILIGYHRTRKVSNIKNMIYSYYEIGRGQLYGPGLYATTDLHSQATDYMKRYGKYLVRCEFNTSNYLNMSGRWQTQLQAKGYDIKELMLKPTPTSTVYKNLHDLLHTTSKDFSHMFQPVELYEKTVVNKDVAKQKQIFMDNLQALNAGFTSVIAKFILKHVIPFKELSSRFDGIIYRGQRDGNCIVAWNTSTCRLTDYADVSIGIWPDNPQWIKWVTIKHGSDILAKVQENPNNLLKLTSLQSVSVIKQIINSRDFELMDKILQVLNKTTEKMQFKLLGVDTQDSLKIYNRLEDLKLTKNHAKILLYHPLAYKIFDIVYKAFAAVIVKNLKTQYVTSGGIDRKFTECGPTSQLVGMIAMIPSSYDMLYRALRDDGWNWGFNYSDDWDAFAKAIEARKRYLSN